jgi:hypothetical protein
LFVLFFSKEIILFFREGVLSLKLKVHCSIRKHLVHWHRSSQFNCAFVFLVVIILVLFVGYQPFFYYSVTLSAFYASSLYHKLNALATTVWALLTHNATLIWFI